MKFIESIDLGNTEYTPAFIEGVVLAANMTPRAITPESWITPLVELDKEQAKPALVRHFELQYSHLMACEYDISNLSQKSDELADFSEGFMTIWPMIEDGWNEVNHISDGTVRMMQALLTTLMLAIDEESTQKQMLEAGINEPPSLHSLLPQLNIMITEVAKAADDLMQGSKAQHINPYKDTGRNDLCPCGSNKKFKYCCGSTESTYE